MKWRIQGALKTVSKLREHIQEKERAQQENDELQRQLLQSQKLDAVGILAAGVAHDCNNSLAAIVAFAEVTQMSLQPNTRE